MQSSLAHAVLALVVAASGGVACALPPGFVRTPIATGYGVLDLPVSMDFAPDGRIFIATLTGPVRVVQNSVLVTQPVVEIPDVSLEVESGVLGLALSPDFATTGYFFVYYTHLDGTRTYNRVSRYTAIGNTAALSSEVVIWQNTNFNTGVAHHGGALLFLNDGTLLIATGDQFIGAYAPNLMREDGKILRLHADGSIPMDNPYLSTPNALPSLYCIGLRNPFRTSIDRATGRVYAGDVGFLTWEEVDRLGGGLDFGWPAMEGPQCYAASCAGATPPIFAWNHDNLTYSAGGPPGQGAIILGPVYRGTQFPADYRGNIFYSNFSTGWMRRLILDDNGNFVGDELFDDPLGPDTIVDIKQGPDGSLYFLALFTGPGGEPGLFKVSYAGAGGVPVVNASASVLAGLPPLAVSFSSIGSFDPDNAPSPLAFAWNFGDGATSTLPDPSHTYGAAGQFSATLSVSDGATAVVSDPLRVVVGRPPVITNIVPAPGLLYRAGDTVLFSGSAVDPDDGPLPASAWSWTVRLLQGQSTHPFAGPILNDHGTITIPTAGRPPRSVSYRIEVTARDSDGLEAKAQIPILPVVSTIDISTQPAGVPIFLDDFPFGTSLAYASVVNFEHHIEAQAEFVVQGVAHAFDHWSNDQPRVHTFTSPEGGGELIAYYRRTNPCGDLDFNNDGVSPDSLDIDDFLLVFSGGPCSNDPACDSIDFNGDGVTPDTADIESILRTFSGGAC